MSKKAYKYYFSKSSENSASDRKDTERHSEVITLYDTEEGQLEKVAIIHNEHHFGGTVNGIEDTFPYPEEQCPCNGEKPPVRAWNGEKILMVSFEEWATNPEIPVLTLNKIQRDI